MKKRLILVLMAQLMIVSLFVSCILGIKGSGNVVKNERQVGMFESISASAGIQVILIQDSVVKVVVEADDNLQNIIITKVSNGRLKIYPEKRISSCTSKKVFVSFITINSVETSSGAEIKSKTGLKLSSLELSCSSGSNIDLTLDVNRLNVDGSSGGDINLSGTVENLDVEVSSGANINTSGLQCKTCNAGASSGADLKVFASEKIIAKASSGGNIIVKGDPKERKIEKSSGGDVSFN